MAGILCEGEQPTGDAYEKAVTRVGLSGRFRSFRDNMQNLEHSDGGEKNMGQTTTDGIVQSQHDCTVVRIGQKAYVEA